MRNDEKAADAPPTCTEATSAAWLRAPLDQTGSAAIDRKTSEVLTTSSIV